MECQPFFCSCNNFKTASMGGEAPSEQGVVESALAVATLEDASSDGGEESDMDDDAAEARLQALTARLEEVN